MKLSIIVPAHNEEQNIAKCLNELRHELRDICNIPYEIIVVNDNSRDGTEEVVRSEIETDSSITLINRRPPNGFGRAVRSGLETVTGDVVVIYMADLSDSPEDVTAYYRKIEEGYDCVFGSRFRKESRVENYPRFKLIVNRIVNHSIRLMFWTKFNDLTNAFKAYRTHVIRDSGPYVSSHFNITLEMSLGVLMRRYNIAEIPIRWSGREWGASNLNLRTMGRRYLSTLLMTFFQKILVSDDLIAERLSSKAEYGKLMWELEERVERLESIVDSNRLEQITNQIDQTLEENLSDEDSNELSILLH
ncbi:MAG: glycosyltransferase family 2 protein [Planctomycetes bacterium]|nr:glycosyltransferase family 2 protein [Planctomycetota bacterium]